MSQSTRGRAVDVNELQAKLHNMHSELEMLRKDVTMKTLELQRKEYEEQRDMVTRIQGCLLYSPFFGFNLYFPFCYVCHQLHDYF